MFPGGLAEVSTAGFFIFGDSTINSSSLEARAAFHATHKNKEPVLKLRAFGRRAADSGETSLTPTRTLTPSYTGRKPAHGVDWRTVRRAADAADAAILALKAASWHFLKETVFGGV